MFQQMFKKMLYKYEHVIKIQVHRGDRDMKNILKMPLVIKNIEHI